MFEVRRCVATSVLMVEISITRSKSSTQYCVIRLVDSLLGSLAILTLTRRFAPRVSIVFSIPDETRRSVTPECLRFMSTLLSNADSRTSTFEQIVTHPWFNNFGWDGLHDCPGPLIPSGCAQMDEMLEFLKVCPKSDAR